MRIVFDLQPLFLSRIEKRWRNHSSTSLLSVDFVLLSIQFVLTIVWIFHRVKSVTRFSLSKSRSRLSKIALILKKYYTEIYNIQKLDLLSSELIEGHKISFLKLTLATLWAWSMLKHHSEFPMDLASITKKTRTMRRSKITRETCH